MVDFSSAAGKGAGGMVMKIKLWQFFLGSSVLLLLSFAILLGVLVQERGATIRLAEREHAGLSYQAALSPVLKAVFYCRSQGFAPASLSQLHQAVDGLNVEARQHESAGFADLKGLAALNTAVRAFLARQSPDGYQAVVEASLLLWQRVGESSRLVIDPDIDLFYLIDVVLRQLPYTATALDRYMRRSTASPSGRRRGSS
jgi:methyl-accepting chemotaxis protein